VDGYAGGVAAQLSQNATFAVDASVDHNGNGMTAKPALGIDVQTVQLVYGYGIAVDKNATSHILRGSAVGAGLKLSEAAHLQFYYNQLARYYLGLTLRL
jgi:hypothetical protein